MKTSSIFRLGVHGMFLSMLLFGATTARGVAPCGDVDDSGVVTTSDALAVLKEAVGLAPDLVCPAISTPLQTGQTLSYGPGDDGDLQAGQPLAYVDNGDGTITDTNTGLMWEKKGGLDYYTNVEACENENGACRYPHSGYNQYTFAAEGPQKAAYDGSVVTIFLNQLNNRCDKDATVPCTDDSDCTGPGGTCGFAGHRDWRLPNLKELQALVDFSNADPDPTVDEAFDHGRCEGEDACGKITGQSCSCTGRGGYWSSTTNANADWYAWAVEFGEGRTIGNVKNMNYFARAVRSAP